MDTRTSPRQSSATESADSVNFDQSRMRLHRLPRPAARGCRGLSVAVFAVARVTMRDFNLPCGPIRVQDANGLLVAHGHFVA